MAQKQTLPLGLLPNARRNLYVSRVFSLPAEFTEGWRKSLLLLFVNSLDQDCSLYMEYCKNLLNLIFHH